MAFKVLKECEQCINNCKQYVDEKIWEKASLMSCPTGKKQTKK